VARAVTEAWHAWFGIGVEAFPEQLIVALPTASNAADVAFASSGAFSPQKFVATLPSVVMAPVLQMTGAVLPLLCLQDGKDTFATARSEAELLCKSGVQSVGVLTVDAALVVSYVEVRA
jgi:hypothetical protein